MFKITLEAARVNVKMTQEQVAKELGVSRWTVSSWENGKGLPNVIEFYKLCELYKCPCDNIFLPTKSTLSG